VPLSKNIRAFAANFKSLESMGGSLNGDNSLRICLICLKKKRSLYQGEKGHGKEGKKPPDSKIGENKKWSKCREKKTELRGWLPGKGKN